MMNKETKIMTSVKLPGNLQKEMLLQIVEIGYGMRGKSRWITEAIEALLEMPNYWEYVHYADDMEKPGKIVSIRISKNLLLRLEKALIEVRKYFPNMEGVKSNIIRASIMQRLVQG